MAVPEISGLGIPQVQDVEARPRFFDIEAGKLDNTFSDMLTDAIQGVDNSMKASEASVQDFVTGKSENLHDVMISMQKAQLSFQMMVEVRNRVIETYQEISRMQV